MLVYIHGQIYFDNRNKSYKTFEAFEEAFMTTFCQKSAFWRAEVEEKSKLMESSRNIKFTYRNFTRFSPWKSK